MSARALFLIGSAKASGTSTSEALASYLRGRMAARGVATTTRFVSRSARGERVRGLVAEIEDADLLVLASPLYVDALPYLVTRAFEHFADGAAARPPARRARFAALLNCGFPEAGHCDTALAICRSFARHAGLEWAGGLALGAGGVVGGRALDSLGGMARHARAALDLAAEALAAGRDIPDEAVPLMARPMLPRVVYNGMVDLHWLRTAGRRGALTRLFARPFPDDAR